MCEHHRKSKDTAFKRDSAFELVGQIATKLSADGKEEAFPGHMHCGCPVAEVALEFFLYKTCRAFSSNPANAGRVYQMTDLHMLKPSTRVFWNQSLRDYTGLCTEDFFAVDYGEPTYATRIALQQLHTQIERLKILGVPIEVGLTFKDWMIIDAPDGMIAYGREDGVIMERSTLEELWEKIKEQRVFCSSYGINWHVNNGMYDTRQSTERLENFQQGCELHAWLHLTRKFPYFPIHGKFYIIEVL